MDTATKNFMVKHLEKLQGNVLEKKEGSYSLDIEPIPIG